MFNYYLNLREWYGGNSIAEWFDEDFKTEYSRYFMSSISISSRDQTLTLIAKDSSFTIGGFE